MTTCVPRPACASNMVRSWRESAMQPSVGVKPGAREMHEDRAALPLDSRPVVIAEHEHEIVEMILALQAFGASPRRQFDQPIVVAARGIVAPAVMRADRMHRQPRARPRNPVGAVEHLADSKAAKRCPAVAFALQGADAAPAERRPPHAVTERYPRLCHTPRRAPHDDRLGSLNPHDGKPFLRQAGFAIRLS